MNTRDKIVALRKQQPSLRPSQIAKLVGVTRQRVCQVLETEGLPTRVAPAMDRPEYRRWWNMLDRCMNPDSPSFKDYGGRGIKVCERWRKFENFLADMGHPPGAGYTIDRTNNDGDYSPSNCRWATKKEQGRNTRSVKLTTRHAAEIRKKEKAR